MYLSEKLTTQDVIDWTVRKPDQDPDVIRRIEADIKQPDSLVREYLDWQSGKTWGTTPRLVKEHMQQPGYLESIVNALTDPTIEPKIGHDSSPKGRGR